MDTRIILAYCLCDDLLKALHHRENAQCQLSDAEVMTVALVASLYYDGNFVDAGETTGSLLKRLPPNRFILLPLGALNSNLSYLCSRSAFQNYPSDGSNLS